MNKRGLLASLIAIMITLFLFAIFGLMTLYMGSMANEKFQSLDNETASPQVKEKIDNVFSYLLYGDKLFVILFVILIAAYIISSVTIPVNESWYIWIFLILLVFVTIFAMIFSNAWKYISSFPGLVDMTPNMKFTDYIMTYFPIVTFFIGIIGATLFYTRRKGGFEQTGGGISIE